MSNKPDPGMPCTYCGSSSNIHPTDAEGCKDFEIRFAKRFGIDLYKKEIINASGTFQYRQERFQALLSQGLDAGDANRICYQYDNGMLNSGDAHWGVWIAAFRHGWSKAEIAKEVQS